MSFPQKHRSARAGVLYLLPHKFVFKKMGLLMRLKKKFYIKTSRLEGKRNQDDKHKCGVFEWDNIGQIKGQNNQLQQKPHCCRRMLWF